MEVLEPVAITVTQLTRIVKNALENRPDLQNVLVRGEISNLTRHSSGHVYFSLKDAGSQVRAVMFSRNAQSVRGQLRDGLEVLAIGSISLYEKRGEYQLYVVSLQPAGLGALYIEFEKLKQKLMDEGLFSRERKKPLPAMPGRVAVITSPTGAAVRDVINVITRRFPAVEITVVPALVQGEEAPASLRRALARAIKLDNVDTILLVRGGGSYEDLWAFNDEAFARDIAACPIPIISGVGHETDFTIADFVADERAPTPSAAAERAVPELELLKQDCAAYSASLRRALKGRVELEKSRLRACAAELAPNRLKDRINQMRQAVDDILRTASLRISHRLQTSAAQVETCQQRLTALDPYGVLRRGYAVLRSVKTGKLITAVSAAPQGTEFDALVSDGAIRSVALQAVPQDRPLHKKEKPAPKPSGGELEF